MEKEKNIGDAAFKAGVWYVISSVMVKAVTIVATPIFTRILSVEEYGIISVFSSWYSLLLPVCSLNLTYSVGRAKIDFPDKLDFYIGSMQMLAAIMTIGLLVVTVFFIEPLSLLMKLDRKIIILLFVYLFFAPAIIFKQNGYRYRYQYKQNIMIAWYMAVSNIGLSLVFLFYGYQEKVILRILGIIFPVVFLSMIFWFTSLKKHTLCINKEYWKYGISLSAPLVVHTISLNILSQSDRILITKMCGEEATGIYSLAYMYALMMSVVTSAISDGWLPWFHDNYAQRKFEDIRKNVKPVVVFGCYIGLASIGLAPEAIRILGGAMYEEGIMCVPPIVLGVVCQFIYTHYVNIEMHMKKTKYVSAGTILASVANIILNWICIPCFGYLAAAYTTLVSYILLLMIHYFITIFVLKVRIYEDKFMFGAIAVMFLLARIIMVSYGNDVFRYSLIVIGFFSFLWFFRERLLKYCKG